MMRTFNKRPFKLREHLERLYRSAKYLKIEIPYTIEQLEIAHDDLLIRNRGEFSPDDEIRTYILASRGLLPAYKELGDTRPWVLITSYPLKWIVKGFSRFYENGTHAIIPAQRQIPARLLEPKVKNRSRIHYRMAELQAKNSCWSSWPLLLDEDGYVTESTGANFFIIKTREIYTPVYSPDGIANKNDVIIGSVFVDAVVSGAAISDDFV